MNVGKVRMCHGFVNVFMRVWLGWISAGRMRVLMMLVVDMAVFVPLGEMQPYAQLHEYFICLC